MSTCPHCGYCEHCKRATPPVRWMYPAPAWPQYPSITYSGSTHANSATISTTGVTTT